MLYYNNSTSRKLPSIYIYQNFIRWTCKIYICSSQCTKPVLKLHLLSLLNGVYSDLPDAENIFKGRCDFAFHIIHIHISFIMHRITNHIQQSSQEWERRDQNMICQREGNWSSSSFMEKEKWYYVRVSPYKCLRKLHKVFLRRNKSNASSEAADLANNNFGSNSLEAACKSSKLPFIRTKASTQVNFCSWKRQGKKERHNSEQRKAVLMPFLCIYYSPDKETKRKKNLELSMCNACQHRRKRWKDH